MGCCFIPVQHKERGNREILCYQIVCSCDHYLVVSCAHGGDAHYINSKFLQALCRRVQTVTMVMTALHATNSGIACTTTYICTMHSWRAPTQVLRYVRTHHAPTSVLQYACTVHSCTDSGAPVCMHVPCTRAQTQMLQYACTVHSCTDSGAPVSMHLANNASFSLQFTEDPPRKGQPPHKGHSSGPLSHSSSTFLTSKKRTTSQ